MQRRVKRSETVATPLFMNGKRMESLIRQRQFKKAFDLIVKELEDDPGNKQELRDLFSFVLTTYR